MVTMATVVVRVCVFVCQHLLLLVLFVMVADVTESQQAIVRVTPADGMQPFTMQSKEDRKKERKEGRKGEHGRKKNKRREADYNHKLGNFYGKSVCCFSQRS